MDNRFFSLIIVPDSGKDIQYRSFNSQFLVVLSGVLIAAFFSCLFFIIGYHIKLRQEKNYRTAMEKREVLLGGIHKAEMRLQTLSAKLDDVQKNDNAFRLYASMKTLDHDMYQAGVGGHVIFDPSELGNLANELVVRAEHLTYGITRLDHQTLLEQSSLGEIQAQIRENQEIISSTPTIIPALTPYLSINSGFGFRNHPTTGHRQFHNAVDIAGRRGDRIIAAAAGVVTCAEWKGALGQCVTIQHKYGYETTYGHLESIAVNIGQKVKKGDFLGTMGSTGNATGVHLHYAVSQNGHFVNPLTLFKSGL
jgi:murein DD-endopeptidase MepM/ murein hydrolase activator NlpD